MASQQPNTEDPPTESSMNLSSEDTNDPQPATHRIVKENMLALVMRHVAKRPMMLQNIVMIGELNFFTVFDSNIRKMIYGYLWGDPVVVIDGAQAIPTQIQRGHFPIVRPGPYTKFYYNPFWPQWFDKPWLRISRRFFVEARGTLWENLAVRFDRRWDLIKSIMNHSLEIRSYPEFWLTVDTRLLLFPRENRPFRNIKFLHINLSDNTDFNGFIRADESRRCIENGLLVLLYELFNLKTLIFTIDDRSKIAPDARVMIPHAWFLELLLPGMDDLYIRHGLLEAVRFEEGYMTRTSHITHCIHALDAVFQEEMATIRAGGSSVLGVSPRIQGDALRKAFAGRMVQWLWQQDQSVYESTLQVLRDIHNRMP